MYGHPSHRNASPSAQLPQLPSFPWTVKSTSASSLAPNFIVSNAASALARLASSSSRSLSASPQVQSLHALRRFPAFGRHSGAKSMTLVLHQRMIHDYMQLTLNDWSPHVFLAQERLLVD